LVWNFEIFRVQSIHWLEAIPNLRLPVFLNNPTGMNMNKSELIEKLAEESGTTKVVAEKVLNAVLSTVTNELKAGGSVALVGFGTFQVNARAARIGRNPKTGDSITIAAAKVPVFKAGASLKNSVNS